MIRFVFGGAGSGKTRYVTDDILRVLRETDKRVFLLVPEQQTVIYETKLAREFPPEYATRLEATSFTRLGNTVARNVGGLACPSLSGGVRALLTWRAVSSVWNSLTYLSSTTAGAKNSLVPAVAAAINELRINGIAPSDLEEAVTEAEKEAPDATLTRKTRDLLTVLAAYTSIISEEYGDGTVEGAVAKTVRRGAESGFFKNTAIYVDSFFSVTKEEYGIISDLMRYADDVTVTVAMESRDSVLAREEPVRTFFRRLNADAVRFGKTETVTLGKNLRAGTDALRKVSEYLFDYGRDPEAADGDGSVRVFSVRDRYAEAEAAASVIEKLVSGGCRYSDIAVIAGDVSALCGITESCFSRHGIPCFMTESVRMESSPMTRAILSLLRIPGEWRQDDVIGLVKTGLTPLTEDESCLLENYTETWNVRYKKMFTSDWSFNPSGYKIGFSDDERKTLEKVNAARGRLIPPIETFCEVFDGGEADVKSVCEALVRYADESGLYEAQMEYADRLEASGDPDGADRERQVWKNFCKCFDTIVTLLPGVKADAEGFSSILRYAMTDTGSGAIPTGVDEVAFGSAGSIRTGEVRHVILLGCVENEFPRSTEDKGFFTDADKNILEEMGIDLWSRNREKAAMELLRFHRCATLPSDTLTMFVPEFSFGAATAPSSGARNVLAVLGLESPVDFSSLPPEDRLFRPAGLLQDLQYAEKSGDRDLAAALREMRRRVFPGSEAEFDGFASETVSEENVRALFGGERETSDSVLESFARCPFSYYMRNVLRLKENKKAEIGRLDVGNFVHTILEQFFSSTAGEEYPLERKRTEEICDGIIENYVLNICGGRANQRTVYLFRRLRRAVLLFVEAIMKEIAGGEFMIFGNEIAFGSRSGDVPPLTFTSADGDTLRIRGVIDRLDVCVRDGVTYLKVVDYKTYTAKFDPNLVEKGLNIQLLIYLFSVWKSGAVNDPVPAGAIYFNLKNMEAAENRMLSEEEARAKFEGLLSRSGVVLSENGVPEAMFGDEKPGKEISYETVEGFGKLYEKLESVIKQIRDEMKKGIGAVRPVDDEHAGCGYCPGKRICKHPYAYQAKGWWGK